MFFSEYYCCSDYQDINGNCTGEFVSEICQKISRM